MIVHVPAPVIVTRFPDTVHTDGGAAVNVTGLPEPPPVALTVNGGSPKVLSASGPKVMVCAIPVTVRMFVPVAVWPSGLVMVMLCMPWVAPTVDKLSVTKVGLR